ncbi:response regulator transcription factor [Phaeacidiphilus oryzae]|jgi:DNA-binding response OmpR family regulator|uniref:response regulator transcription factor n=1 Tax=Phaeacidiphilus oryzae TaxID=348818 RepID=UPI00055F65D7|nr:response regulator transcription factor [Phaeacidiphilus oryzae]
MPAQATVLVYSDDRNTREQVRLALGRRSAAGGAGGVEFRYIECATVPAVLRSMDLHAKGEVPVHLVVLDGEAVPAGGMGVCRQLKDEIYGCPPVLLLIGRPQDAWLAGWSRADAAVPAPVDPSVLASTAAELLGRSARSFAAAG